VMDDLTQVLHRTSSRRPSRNGKEKVPGAVDHDAGEVFRWQGQHHLAGLSTSDRYLSPTHEAGGLVQSDECLVEVLGGRIHLTRPLQCSLSAASVTEGCPHAALVPDELPFGIPEGGVSGFDCWEAEEGSLGKPHGVPGLALPTQAGECSGLERRRPGCGRASSGPGE
jgi:hypothetical protein